MYVYEQAKDMVSLVNKFAAKIEEKKGALSEDEVSVHLVHVYLYNVYVAC